MTTLFSQEDVLEAYAEEMRRETEKKTAIRMIQDGKILLEDIVRYVPSLSMDEIRQIAAGIAPQA